MAHVNRDCFQSKVLNTQNLNVKSGSKLNNGYCNHRERCLFLPQKPKHLATQPFKRFSTNLYLDTFCLQLHPTDYLKRHWGYVAPNHQKRFCGVIGTANENCKFQLRWLSYLKSCVFSIVDWMTILDGCDSRRNTFGRGIFPDYNICYTTQMISMFVLSSELNIVRIVR